MSDSSSQKVDRISILMLIYTAASLLHFVHNATYLHEYPNMPPSLTPFGVYGAWCAVAAVGLLGYWVRRRAHGTGLALIALYAILGFGGLDHYVIAPVAAHTFVMNLTIVIEVAAAVALLAAVALALKERRNKVPA